MQNYFNLIGGKECNLSVIALLKPVQNPVITPDWSFNRVQIVVIITHWEKLLDSDWLRHCDLRANSVIRGKLQMSRAKSVIHSECKYKKKLTVNNE